MNYYRILINLLSLPVIFYILWVSIRNNDLRFLLQRLGFKYAHAQSYSIWVHAASVGEVNAATPLIQKLSTQKSIILTTNTPSSARQAAKILNENITHVYCPVDWKWAIHKFIKQFQPCDLYIIETELWPNLFSACHSHNIPITIINGRLSERTLKASNWLKKEYRKCLSITQAVLTRSEEDTQRFIALGASASIVKTIGNIKFYQQENIKNIAAFKSSKPYVLAASTRDEEEALIVTAWQAAISKTEDDCKLLVIVPRHPHRLTTIVSQLKPFNLNIAIRSKNEDISDDTDIYIADTFGELTSFIKGAEFVIMGGSFVNKGGQNILEVAHAGKMVVFGPYMDNFKDEAQLFVKKKAGIQLKSVNALSVKIHSLLIQPKIIEELQQNAEQLIEQQQTILPNYISELQKLNS